MQPYPRPFGCRPSPGDSLSYWRHLTKYHNVFQIWSKQASYEELARGFEPITTGEIFWVMIVKTMIINDSLFLSLDFWISFSLVTKGRNKFCKQLF